MFDSQNPWLTTFEGRTYPLIRSILNHLLIETDSQLTLRQCYTLKDAGITECHASKCLGLNEIGHHIAKCLDSPGDPLVDIQTLVTFHGKRISVLHEVRYICTRDFCNSEEVSNEIVRLTRKEFGLMPIWNVEQNLTPNTWMDPFDLSQCI